MSSLTGFARWIIVLLALSIGAPAAQARAQRPCEELLSEPEVSRLVGALDRVAAIAPVWDAYAPGNHPVLLAGDTTFASAGGRACVAVWQYGHPPRTAGLPARLLLSTPLYGFVGGVGVPRIDSAVAMSLASIGVTRAVILPVPLRLESLGALGAFLMRAGEDPVRISVDLAVHEGFHLHVQMPRWAGAASPYAWPVWDQQPDRRQVRERCYAGTPDVAMALSGEIAALLGAFDALFPADGPPDRAAALRSAGEFIDIRARRRALQDTSTVSQGNQRIRCELAEDILEVEEGVAQWVGHATLLAAGLSSIARLRGSYGAAQPEAFYRTGPLQLWILRGLIGDHEMRAMTSALARSATPEGADGGLFGRFSAMVSER